MKYLRPKTLLCLILIFTCVTDGGLLDLSKRIGVKVAEQTLGPNKKPTTEKSPSFDWLLDSCNPIKRILSKKIAISQRIEQLVVKLKKDDSLSDETKKYQAQTFYMFSKELNETEAGIWDALQWLDNVMSGDYRNLINLKEKSKNRLDWLKNAVLKEEEEYNVIEEAEVGLEKVNKTEVKGLMSAILEDIAKAADDLEESLNEKIFKGAAENLSNNKKMAGGNIETVIRIREKAEEDRRKQREDDGTADNTEELGVIKFVDSKDNLYVLSKGRDSTMPLEDSQLIQDIIALLCVSTLCGWLCTLVKLPSMFGYIVTGVLLGPSGLNKLKSLVQLETIGEFGIFFILFCVGLEFSPSQLKKVFKVSTIGMLTLTLLMVLMGVGLAAVTESSLVEGGFVAACLSMSSTPLVVKFLMPPEGSNPTDYGSVLLGLLIMQDVFLGLLMAALPVLASTALASDNLWASSILTYGWILMKLVSALSLVLVLAFGFCKLFIGPMYVHLLKSSNKELTVSVTVTLAFLILSLTNYLGISMELGCFIAGVMISAQGYQIATSVEHVVQPIKDFFSCLFFASIGLHVFPQFLAYQVYVTLTLTMAVVTIKFLLGVVVLGLLTRRTPGHVKWVVSAGLAQVSEFAFVLCSRARHLGLISREVYLLILSITTLSLLFAPILWQCTLFRLHIKHNHQSSVQLAQLPGYD